jgi:hypothetical protein
MWMHLGDLKRLHHKLAVALGDRHPDVALLDAEITDCEKKSVRPTHYACAAQLRDIRRSTSQRLRNLNMPIA